MIEEIRFRLTHRKLLRQSQDYRKRNRTAINRATAEGKSAEEIEYLRHTAEHDDREFDELIRESITTNLCNRARNLILPLPSEEDAWSEGYLYRSRILTEKGIAELRSTIRKEKSERIVPWVTLLSLIIGLIGAATALVGVLAEK